LRTYIRCTLNENGKLLIGMRQGMKIEDPRIKMRGMRSLSLFKGLILPFHLYRIFCDKRIRGQDGQIMGKGLADKYPIKGILMMLR
jgi:hypothetical protein